MHWMRLHDLDRSGSSRTNDAVRAVRMFRAGVGGPYEVAAGRVGFRLDGWDYWMTPASREEFDKISLEHAGVRGWPLMYLVADGAMTVWPVPAVDMQMIVEAADGEVSREIIARYPNILARLADV